jgi:hypothetical protein
LVYIKVFYSKNAHIVGRNKYSSRKLSLLSLESSIPVEGELLNAFFLVSHDAMHQQPPDI